MKVVLVAINASYIHTSLAMYSLAANSIPVDVSCELKEYHINMDVEQILEDLCSANGDVYLFSVYIWNSEFMRKIISRLKKIKKIVTVGGGSEIGYTPQEALTIYRGLDYILSGEGEILVKNFLTFLKEGKNPISLDNVFSKETNNKKVINQPVDMASLKFPYTKEMLPMLKNRIIYYESSRGCPFNCSYCISQIDKRVRFRPLSAVFADLDFFMENQIPLVKFVDRTFNINAERTKKILRYILDKNKKTTFHFEICAELLDDELIQLLCNAPKGTFQLEAGIQSANPHTLNAVNRKTNLKVLAQKLRALTMSGNMHIHADLIAGLPLESFIQFQESFNYAYEVHPHMLQLGFLKVLKGTNMQKMAEDYGVCYCDEPPYEVLSTNAITFNELQLLKKVSYIVDKYYNSMKFNYTIHYMASLASSPYCFFESLTQYVFKYITTSQNVSLKRLYELLAKYSEKHFKKSEAVVQTLLAYDYLINQKFPLPNVLQSKYVHIINKNQLFEWLKNEQFVLKFMPEYKNCTPKERFKKVYSVQFSIHPDTLEKKDCIYLFKPDSEEKAILIHF